MLGFIELIPLCGAIFFFIQKSKVILFVASLFLLICLELNRLHVECLFALRNLSFVGCFCFNGVSYYNQRSLAFFKKIPIMTKEESDVMDKLKYSRIISSSEMADEWEEETTTNPAPASYGRSF